MNWGEKVLHDGSTLHDRDAFIYGGALTLDVEFYVADRIALLANLRERLLWGGRHTEVPYAVRGGRQDNHQLTRRMERTDIENMRQIPIADFLARLGHEPVRRSGNELWYRAPYRSERTPSFRVNVAKQLWYDFGLGKGGDIFTLVGEFTPKRGFHGAGEIHSGNRPYAACRSRKAVVPAGTVRTCFEGVEAVPLLRSPLTEYLKERGILMPLHPATAAA